MVHNFYRMTQYNVKRMTWNTQAQGSNRLTPTNIKTHSTMETMETNSRSKDVILSGTFLTRPGNGKQSPLHIHGYKINFSVFCGPLSSILPSSQCLTNLWHINNFTIHSAIRKHYHWLVGRKVCIVLLWCCAHLQGNTITRASFV